MHRNLQLDTACSRRWSMALVRVAFQDAPGNGEVLRRWIGEAAPAVIDAVVAASEPLSTPAFTLAPEQTRRMAAEAIQAGAGEFGSASAMPIR
jgi:hypothetical protein